MRDKPTEKITKYNGKKRLFAAADELFSAGGYKEVNVADILDLSGVRAPSLYHHFEDKEGLYVTWAEFALKRRGTVLAEFLDRKPNRAKFIRGISDVFWGVPKADYLQILRDRLKLKHACDLTLIEDTYRVCLIEPLQQYLTSHEFSTTAEMVIHILMSANTNYAFPLRTAGQPRRQHALDALETLLAKDWSTDSQPDL